MKRVLIIEDNEGIRDNTAELLELAGYEVITAENGEVGLAKASANLPGIILCDIRMPVKNGFEVLVSLKSNAATSKIPFILFTASIEKKEIQKATDFGADGYLGKPFEPNELLEEIEKWLR